MSVKDEWTNWRVRRPTDERLRQFMAPVRAEQGGCRRGVLARIRTYSVDDAVNYLLTLCEGLRRERSKRAARKRDYRARKKGMT